METTKKLSFQMLIEVLLLSAWADFNQIRSSGLLTKNLRWNESQILEI